MKTQTQETLHKNEKSATALPSKQAQKKVDRFNRPEDKYFQRHSIGSNPALLKQASWTGEPMRQMNEKNLKNLRSSTAFAPTPEMIESLLKDIRSSKEESN